MRFFAGETELDAGPGDFVLLPKSVPHTFVVGAEPLHALQLTTPAGFEDFAAAVGMPAQRRIEILGPPPVH